MRSVAGVQAAPRHHRVDGRQAGWATEPVGRGQPGACVLVAVQQVVQQLVHGRVAKQVGEIHRVHRVRRRATACARRACVAVLQASAEARSVCAHHVRLKVAARQLLPQLQSTDAADWPSRSLTHSRLSGDGVSLGAAPAPWRRLHRRWRRQPCQQAGLGSAWAGPRRRWQLWQRPHPCRRLPSPPACCLRASMTRRTHRRRRRRT